MTSHTRYLKLTNWERSEASIVLRMMMISNDINMCFRLRYLLKANETLASMEIDAGIEQYLLRLASAQAFEALSILPELEKSPSIKQILDHNEKAKAALVRLREYKEGGRSEKPWRILRSIRNKGLFHYESVGEWLVDCLEKRVQDGLKISSFIWHESESLPPRFTVADEIHETVFTYKILEHHDGKDFDKALEESLEILEGIQKDFGELVVPLILESMKNRYV